MLILSTNNQLKINKSLSCISTPAPNSLVFTFVVFCIHSSQLELAVEDQYREGYPTNPTTRASLILFLRLTEFLSKFARSDRHVKRYKTRENQPRRALLPLARVQTSKRYRKISSIGKEGQRPRPSVRLERA